MTDSNELQVKDKQEAASPAEQTRPGIIFTPDVDTGLDSVLMNAS